jgi:hypothetical protein
VPDRVRENVSGPSPAVVNGEDWDQFGDGDQTAMLILEAVALPRVADRAAILPSLAQPAVEGAEIPEPHIGHIRRFLLAAEGERTIRRVT